MVRFVKYQDVFRELDIQEDVQAGILIRVFGELKGMFLFLMDEAFTRAVLDGMLEKKERNLTSLDEMERSVLSELGNIMCGSSYTCTFSGDGNGDRCICAGYVCGYGRSNLRSAAGQTYQGK